MAEVIQLAGFDLDTQKLQKSLSDLQDTYFDLRKEQKAYADQSKETAKQIDILTKSQKLLEESAGDNTDAIDANEKELQALLKTQKDLYKSEQNLGVQMGTVRKEINQTTTQIKAYQDAEGKSKSLIDLGNEALGKQIKNKNDARAANIALNNIANQLNPNIDEEAKLLKQLNNQMDKNTEFIKENSSETAKQKMNVGNYQSALQGVDAVLAKFGINGQEARTVVAGFSSTVSKAGSDIVNYSNSLIQTTASTLGFKTASQLANESQVVQTATTETQTAANTALATSTEATTVATTASTLGLRAFTIALASTGIGLIVVALGALFSYLKDLDPLLDKIQQGFAAVGAAVRVLGNAISTLSFDGLGDSMARAATEAAKLKEAQQDLADLQNSQEVANAKASQQYDELIVKSKNRTLTEKERISFLQQAQKIEEANYIQRSNLANAELNQAIKNAQIKGELSAQEVKNLQANTLAYGTYLLNKGKITEEDLDSLKKAELGKIAIDAESTKRLEKNQNAQDKLFDDAQKKREKQAQAEQQAADKKKQADEKALERLFQNSKEQIDLFVAQQGLAKKSVEEERSFNEKLQKQLEDDAKLRFEKGKISKTAYETEKLNITAEFAKKDVEIVIENANLELETQLHKNALILENDKLLTDEQVKLKQNALNENLLAEENFQKTRLEKGIINQQEYDLAVNAAKEKNRLDNEQLEANRVLAQQQKALIDLENQTAAQEENFISNGEIQKAQNEIKRQQEVIAAEKTGASVSDINAKYAKQNADIDKAVQDNKIQLASNAFGTLANIFGAESKAGKAAAIAQTTIDTYKGATSAFSSLSGIPIVGPILGAIAAAAAIAAGIANVKKITSTKNPEVPHPSYASGVIGVRGAGTATSDNISANLSAGESVINAKGTSMFANELATINKLGNGQGINGASNILNQNQIENNANNSQMAQMIAEAVAVGAEAGTSKGSQNGIRKLSDDRKIMSDAKF